MAPERSAPARHHTTVRLGSVRAGGLSRLLQAVAERPATWRIILLPPEGIPAVVRQHIETNRRRTLERIEQMVRWAMARQEVPDELDAELTARAARDLAEDA